MSKEEYKGIKFNLVFEEKTSPHHPLLDELKKWCAVFHEKGLAPPYTGGSYGNLSFRTSTNSYIITGTCIGLKNTLDSSCFVEVISCDTDLKEVFVKGMRAPSSESFMHHIIYQSRPDIHAIFHGHSPLIVKYAGFLGIPETTKKTSYGTPELAECVKEIAVANNFIVIKEHGFVSLGTTMQYAGDQALQWLEKASLI